MTATNHALAGALVGAAITQPAIALPLAFISHFAMDVIPHFGFEEWYGHEKNKKKFLIVYSFDFLIFWAFIGYLLSVSAPWLVFACIFLAILPDFMWAYLFIIKENFGRTKPTRDGPFAKFHKQIQRYEFSKGLLVEVPVAIILFFVLVKII